MFLVISVGKLDPTLDVTNRSVLFSLEVQESRMCVFNMSATERTLSQYFTGVVKKHILNVQLPQ